MKTIEEKAKAYDEALERAQKATRAGSDVAMDIVQYIFPELRESEDEKIRKFICSIIDNLEPKDFVGVKKMNVLAWLEKHEECVADSSKTSADEDERIKKFVIEELEITRYAISGNHYSDDPYIVARLKHLDEALDWLEKQKESLHISETYKENPDSFTDKSEDKRIIQNLIDAFTEYKKSGGIDFHGIEINTLLSWLEKQKELFESGKGLYYYDGEKTTYCGYPATEENPYDFAMNQQEKQKEQKPAWSEEDEKLIRLIISILEAKHPKGFWRSNEMESGVYTEELVDFLKRLRPYWKPSEWQMKALERTIHIANFGLEVDRRKALESLYEELKQLQP